MINKKLGEDDIQYPVLSILNASGAMTTSELREGVKKFVEATGENLKPLENRNDTAIDQIIRNIVSHRNDSPNNMIYKGLIDYQDEKLSITPKGKECLKTLSQQLYENSMK